MDFIVGINILLSSKTESDMPGSYPDPRSYADTALQALERAYAESPDPHTSSLIMTAMEAIRRLTQEMKGISTADNGTQFDPHELNDLNSAI
jgi:hypothetical protein